LGKSKFSMDSKGNKQNAAASSMLNLGVGSECPKWSPSTQKAAHEAKLILIEFVFYFKIGKDIILV